MPSAPNSTRLKVAWLAAHDLRRFNGLFDRPGAAGDHDTPWIANGARALADSGAVDLHVVTYDKRFTRDRTIADTGVTFHLLRTPAPRVPRAAAFYRLDVHRFLGTLDAIQPDIVHGHGTENIYSYAAVRSRYPAVISMQAIVAELMRTYTGWSRTRCEHAFVRLIERYTIRRAEWAIVKAPFVEALIRRVNPALQTRLIENIVSPPFFTVARDPGASTRRIVYVGRLTPSKGVEDLIAAFHDVAASHPALELHLIGDGSPSYVSRLQRLIGRGPISRRIVWRGTLSASEIAAEYVDATMLVLPSYYDTSPNSVAEAMVAGVPVIGTAVGGVPFMLEEGANGQLVRPGDVGALANAIRFNLQHPQGAAERAARARTAARARYGRDLYVTRMLSTYRAMTTNRLEPCAALSA